MKLFWRCNCWHKFAFLCCYGNLYCCF